MLKIVKTVLPIAVGFCGYKYYKNNFENIRQFTYDEVKKHNKENDAWIIHINCVYGQLKRELNKFSKITNKYIIMHDTTVDAIFGETIRNNCDAQKQSKQTGFPIEEINCGLWKAIEEFLEKNSDWKLKERFINCNGLTILERII